MIDIIRLDLKRLSCSKFLINEHNLNNYINKLKTKILITDELLSKLTSINYSVNWD